MHLTRTRVLRVAVAVATAAGLLAVATPAQAQRTAFGPPPVINVDVTTAGGFALPATVEAGYVTFVFSSPEAAYHGIQGFQTKNGSTPADVVHYLDLGVNSTQENAAIGHQLLLQYSTLIGGAVTFLGIPISVTIPMEPGTYYFFDLNDFFAGIPARVHTIVATGEFQKRALPNVGGTIIATMLGEQPQIVGPSNLHAGDSFLAMVKGDELHEIVFRQAKDFVDDGYISTFYDAVREGTPRPPSPWLTRQFGLQAMSPDRWAIVHLDLPPGKYAAICFVPSDESGFPHAWIGMHKVMDVD